MAALVRLMRRAFLALLACVAMPALALECQLPFDEPLMGTNSGTSATSTGAAAACAAKSGRKYKWQNWTTTSSATISSDECRLYQSENRYVLWSHRQDWNGMANGVCTPGSATTEIALTVFYFTTWVPPTTETQDCLNLNTTATPGDRLFVEGHQPAAYCNGICVMAVSETPSSCSPGINPATGEPVNWCTHGQSYSGQACPDDGLPGDNPVSTPDPQNPSMPVAPGQWSCEPTLGMCTDPEGDLQYCTFTGTPPVRSACVGAVPDGDNDGIPDNRDSAPNDPANGEDSGVGDETDNTSIGGGDCGNPPQSTGDGILSQIAYQAWATRCAVKALDLSVTVTGGSTSGTPGSPGGALCTETLTCTGMTGADCFALAQQKRETCAAEAVQASAATLAANPANGNCAPGDTACSDLGSSGVTGGEGGTGWTTLPGGGGGTPDDSGWLGNRTCPAPVSVSVLGMTIDLNRDQFCDFMGIGSMLVLIGAALACAKIIGGAI